MKIFSYAVMAMALIYLGFTIGMVIANRNQPDELTLKPYSGIGSGVLAPGTILKEEYQGPPSVIGRVEGGVWILERSE